VSEQGRATLLGLAVGTAREAGELILRLRDEGVEVAGTKSSEIDIVTRGQERGEFSRTIDPRLAVAAFFGTASSIVSGAVFREGEVSPQEIHRQFLQLTFQGLAPAGSTGRRK